MRTNNLLAGFRWLSDYHRSSILQFHPFRAQPTRFMNNAAKDRGDARMIKWASAFCRNAFQNLLFAPGVVGWNSHGDLDHSYFSGDRSSPVEQPQQLGIEGVDFQPPVRQRFLAMSVWLAHEKLLKAKTATLRDRGLR